jgi:ubiquinone/menaquinone biosynthesis C-methylase UbiE
LKPKSRFRHFLSKTPLRLFPHRLNEKKLASEIEAMGISAPDGFAVPPALLIVEVAGRMTVADFLSEGLVAADGFCELAEKYGAPWGPNSHILDWGCGCGRVARHLLVRNQVQITGIDVNPRQIEWAKNNLLGTFRTCNLLPPLSGIADQSFDGAFGFSVLTHLKGPTQRLWLFELSRVLKDGAITILTFHDENHEFLDVSGASRPALYRDGITWNYNFAEGSNALATFQTSQWLGNVATEAGFRVMEVKAPNASFRQSSIVLRKQIS